MSQSSPRRQRSGYSDSSNPTKSQSMRAMRSRWRNQPRSIDQMRSRCPSSPPSPSQTSTTPWRGQSMHLRITTVSPILPISQSTSNSPCNPIKPMMNLWSTSQSVRRQNPLRPFKSVSLQLSCRKASRIPTFPKRCSTV